MDLATKFVSLKKKRLEGVCNKTWTRSFCSCTFLTYNCDQISEEMLIFVVSLFVRITILEVLVNVNNICMTFFSISFIDFLQLLFHLDLRNRSPLKSIETKSSKKFHQKLFAAQFLLF